jgi:hypothetical protein
LFVCFKSNDRCVKLSVNLSLNSRHDKAGIKQQSIIYRWTNCCLTASEQYFWYIDVLYITRRTFQVIKYLEGTIWTSVLLLLYYNYLLTWRGVLVTTLCDKVCQWPPAGRWFSPGTLVSSTNKTDRHAITEILLKVALNTITLTPTFAMSSENQLF